MVVLQENIDNKSADGNVVPFISPSIVNILYKIMKMSIKKM